MSNESLEIDSDSGDDQSSKVCLLWAMGGTCLSAFGLALIGTIMITNDPQVTLKLSVGLSLLLGGIAFCSAGALIERYGTFAHPRPHSESSEDVNEITPFVVIRKEM